MFNNRIFVAIILALFVVSMVGCMMHSHTIGQGPQQGRKVEKRAWYALWGLVPLNEVDGGKLASGTANCRVTTQQGPLDILINILTGYLSFYSRTVTVEY